MITYIVACYFGPRRVHDQAYIDDPMLYIKWHCVQLATLKFNLIEKIIFVVNGDEPLQLKPQIRDIPVEVLHRENVGMSYGAWNKGMQHSNSEYCFLIEDDYIPVVDNFDQVFLDNFKDQTGYVCSLYRWGHAAITNGLIKTEAIMSVGGVPYAPSSNYGANEQVGQIGMSKILEAHGWGVEDISSDHSVPFLDAKGGILYYGAEGAPRVVSPVMLERNDTAI